MNDKKNLHFHDDAPRYEAWFETFNELFNSEVKAIQEVMEPHKKNLEIGVGTGLFAKRLSIPEGIEPSASMREIAENRGVSVCNALAENLPIQDQSYEQVFMITADCFMQNLPKAIEEVHRILVQNGILILAFLDRETPIGTVYEERKKTDSFYKRAHFRSADEMKDLVIKSGFRLEKEVQTVFTYNNVFQLPKPGHGEGVFVVFKARKQS